MEIEPAQFEKILANHNALVALVAEQWRHLDDHLKGRGIVWPGDPLKVAEFTGRLGALRIDNET